MEDPYPAQACSDSPAAFRRCARLRYNGSTVWPFDLRRRKQGKLSVTREASFAARPVRNPVVEWDSSSEGPDLMLTIPRRRSARANVLAWMFGVPDERKLVLDEMGSFVWRQCDGEHSVQDLVAELVRQYRLSQREATVSLTTYLRTLGRRNLVAFAVDRSLLEPAPVPGEQKEASGTGEKGKHGRHRRSRRTS